MKNLTTPNITLALVLVAAMAAVALRCGQAARATAGVRRRIRAVHGEGTRSPGPRPVPLSRCRTYFTSCTPMGAMLLAPSATASTGRRRATSEPRPEPLILGLVPGRYAVSAGGEFPRPEDGGAAADVDAVTVYGDRDRAPTPGCLDGGELSAALAGRPQWPEDGVR